MSNNQLDFWGHLDELRSVLWRMLIVLVAVATAFFVFMPDLFDQIILAPCSSSFWLYEYICTLSEKLSVFPEFCAQEFTVSLININLSSQFFVHITTSMWLALVFSFPILLYLAWTFVREALYESEKKNVRLAFAFGCVMFFVGVLVGYMLIFPLTLRFLAGYQLSAAIPNQISLDSYISNFLIIVFMMGVLFELPLLCWLLSSLGILKRSFFSKYRRHAVVVLLVLAAFITPTGDPFTLMAVFLPIYILYELSAFIVKK